MRTIGWLGITAGLLFVGGVYVLLLAFAPYINAPVIGFDRPDVRSILLSTPPGQKGDWLYIPQINVSMPIKPGDESVLLHNIWHRVPQNGDPQKGGNFVLSGHRFYMGWTPGQTVERSPLYNIDKLKVGDEFFVDFGGKRYAYTISRLYAVPPTATQIEEPSVEPKLTLYSCDLRGSAVGRVVVEAAQQ